MMANWKVLATAARGESWEPRAAVYQVATLFHMLKNLISV